MSVCKKTTFHFSDDIFCIKSLPIFSPPFNLIHSFLQNIELLVQTLWTSSSFLEYHACPSHFNFFFMFLRNISLPWHQSSGQFLNLIRRSPVLLLKMTHAALRKKVFFYYSWSCWLIWAHDSAKYSEEDDGSTWSIYNHFFTQIQMFLVHGVVLM